MNAGKLSLLIATPFILATSFFVIYKSSSSNIDSNRKEYENCCQTETSNKTTMNPASSKILQKSTTLPETPQTQITIIEEIKPTLASLPGDLSEVKKTDLLKEYLEQEDNGERLDHRLRLLKKIDDCLGEQAPKQGRVILHLAFKIPPQGDTATGISPNEVHESLPRYINSTVNEDELISVITCIEESNLEELLEVKQLNKMEADENKTTVDEVKNKERKFIRTTAFDFPLNQDFAYQKLRELGAIP